MVVTNRTHQFIATDNHLGFKQGLNMNKNNYIIMTICKIKPIQNVEHRSTFIKTINLVQNLCQLVPSKFKLIIKIIMIIIIVVAAV